MPEPQRHDLPDPHRLLRCLPGDHGECAEAIRRIAGTPVRFSAKQGCTEVRAAWAHWHCLLPHGPGMKHTRPIVLEPWQREVAVARQPARFVRGLIHSDCCRILNRVVTGGKEYAYWRYMFTNRSDDIRRLFLDACGALGVDARPSNAVTVSVARRESVRRLDGIVGPKA